MIIFANLCKHLDYFYTHSRKKENIGQFAYFVACV